MGCQRRQRRRHKTRRDPDSSSSEIIHTFTIRSSLRSLHFLQTSSHILIPCESDFLLSLTLSPTRSLAFTSLSTMPENPRSWTTFCPTTGVKHVDFFRDYGQCSSCGGINPNPPLRTVIRQSSVHPRSEPHSSQISQAPISGQRLAATVGQYGRVRGPQPSSSVPRGRRQPALMSNAQQEPSRGVTMPPPPQSQGHLAWAGQAEAHRRTGFRTRTVAPGRNAGSTAVSSRAHGPTVVQATSTQKAVTYLFNCTLYTQKLRITPSKTKGKSNLWTYSPAETTSWRDASYEEEFSRRPHAEHDPSLLAFLLSRRPSGIKDAPNYLDHYLIDGINDFGGNCPRPIALAALGGDTLAAQTRALDETPGRKKSGTRSFDVKILLQLSVNNATRRRYQEHLEPREGAVVEDAGVIDSEPDTAIDDDPQEAVEEDHLASIEDDETRRPIKAEHTWTHRVVQPGAKAPEFIDLSTPKGKGKQPVRAETVLDGSGWSRSPSPGDSGDGDGFGAGPSGFGAGPSAFGAGPSGLGAGPSGLGVGPSGLGAGPSADPDAGPPDLGAGPSDLGAGPSGLGAGPSGFGVGPSSLGDGVGPSSGLGAGSSSGLGAGPLSDHHQSPRKVVAVAKTPGTPAKSKKPKATKKKKTKGEGGSGGGGSGGSTAHKRIASTELSPAVTRGSGRRKE